MIDVAPTLWWQAFIALAATTGMRKSEMLNLTWRDVDFERCAIRVTAKRRGTFKGRDGATYPVLAWSAKSYQDRTIPIPESTLAAARPASQPERQLGLCVSVPRHGSESSPLNWISGEMGPNYQLVNNMAVRFKAIQRKARAAAAAQQGTETGDVPWPVGSIHDLRRTYGTHMAREIPLHVLKEYLGHADIKTTQAFYLAAESQDAANTRRALDAMIAPPGRNQDAMGISGARPGSAAKDKPLQMQGLGSEADGTRTRNHRIDSPGL